MAENRGKQFEEQIKKSFEKVKGVSVDRLHDQTTGYLGSTNICDFIVYAHNKRFGFINGIDVKKVSDLVRLVRMSYCRD